MLKRLLGEDFILKDSSMVSATSISDMAQRLLEEFRRLNLYAIRYRTALWLAEEIAIQPPHPWLVTPNTQKSTVAYDMERAGTHLRFLKETKSLLENEHWHRYTEVIHHCSSAILGNYGGFIGHKYLFPLHVLRTWLTISESNVALWSFCELKMMTTDCDMLKLTKDEFALLLKRIDIVCNLRRPEEGAGHLKNAERLFQLASDLITCRERMRRTKTQLNEGTISAEDRLLLAREAILPVIEPRRAKPLINRHSGRQLGWSANLDFTGTALARRSPLSLFFVDTERDQLSKRSNVVEDAIDAIQGHRFSDVAFLLGRESEYRSVKKRTDEIQKGIGDKVVFPISFEALFRCKNKEDLTYILMNDMLDSNG